MSELTLAQIKAQLMPGRLKGVKRIIAVASGKGGVGKSTVAANLALALKQHGMQVGLLDADIYGPSQPLMLGVETGKQPEQAGEQGFEPIIAQGIQTMSMGYLVSESTPMVWRGPMASGALQQLLFQTHWQNIDYLIIDMPPGTGDIQLTLAQKVPVDGALIVTTPQDIALLDAKKAIEMFAKVHVPILGLVENMAIHVCTECGHQEAIFGEGGGARMAEMYHTQVLAQIPLTKALRMEMDQGTPTVVARPEGIEAKTFLSLAESCVRTLWQQEQLAEQMPEIIVSED